MDSWKDGEAERYLTGGESEVGLLREVYWYFVGDCSESAPVVQLPLFVGGFVWCLVADGCRPAWR